MKVLIAPDSYKGSLSASEVSEIIAKNISLSGKSEVYKLPMSDGGEGFSETVTAACGGETITVKVKNPHGKLINASYGIIKDKVKTAVIDVASASGLILISKFDRDPVTSSTYGTGQMILDAVNRGCKKIILGLGGSATNDCGTGILSALGIRFYTRENVEIKNICGGNLCDVARIDTSDLSEKLLKTQFVIACDVDNPLVGENGAAYVYAPQKGATKEGVIFLDNCLRHFASVIESQFGKDIATMKHGGAAGGIAAGLSVFFNTEIKSGFDIVSSVTELEEKVKKSDIVITGEGCTDSQSLCGKLPVQVAKISAKYNKPCILISGNVLLTDEEISSSCFYKCYKTMLPEDTVDTAMKNAENRLAELVKGLDFTG